jgi:Bacterial lipid A biosynthesis acyltransferase
MQSSPSELAARLAEVEEPTAPLLEVRDAPLVTRLRRRQAHRVVPAPAGVAAAVAAARLIWAAWPDARTQSCAWARTVLGEGAADDDVDRLARAYLVERSANSELTWRPWLGRRMRVDGIEHLTAARAGGSGAVVAVLHMGPFLLLVHALCAQGMRPYMVAGNERSGVVEGRFGGWLEFQRRQREAAGGRTLCTGSAFPVARALLERGEVVVSAWDVPGSATVELLGRPASVRYGAARLAEATGVPLLPAVVWREHARPRARIGAPIDPSGGAEGMLSELTAELNAELRRRLPQAQGGLAHVFRAAGENA